VISDGGAGVLMVVVSTGLSVVLIVGLFVGLRLVVIRGFFVVVTAGGLGWITGGTLVVFTEEDVWITGFVSFVSGFV
jgi:hypothetical protein